jgi:PAS domain S-box-containing protein
MSTEDRYRAMVEMSSQGLYVQQDGRIRYANPACARLFGYGRPGDLTGMSWEALVVPEERPALRARAEAYLRGEAVSPHPGWLGLRKDGSRLWLESREGLISWDGRPAILSTLADVTARKCLEEQCRQAQQLVVLGRLAGGVAHDFNNLLTIITGYADLAEQSLPRDDPARQLLSEILKAGERAATLIRRLLTLGRPQAPQPRALDLGDLVRDADLLLRRLLGNDVELHTGLDPHAGPVWADRGRLEQALLLLAVNARDALPRGGALTLTVGPVELPQTQDGVPAGQYVALALGESGPDREQAPGACVVDSPSSVAGGEFTGPVVGAVQDLVRPYGGHITVDSQPGRGTTVRVYLPRRAGPAPGRENG